MNSLFMIYVRYELDSVLLGRRVSRQPCTVARTSSSPGSSGNMGYNTQLITHVVQANENRYRKFFCQDLFTEPPPFSCFDEELHVAVREMGTMMRVKYQDARWVWLVKDGLP